MNTSGIITTFADVEAREIQWLWYPYVPMSHITLAIGSRGTDVNQFLYEFASQISTGRFHTADCAEDAILLVDGEKNSGWVKTQLEKFGADTGKISFIPECSISELLTAKDQIKNHTISVVIISSVENLILTKKTIKPAEVNDLLRKLNVFASETGCAVILGSGILHPEGDDISRSLAEPIRRFPRSVLSVSGLDGGYTIRQTKNSLAELGKETSWTQNVHTRALDCSQG
ncbi:MAG: hypothetical protein IJH64_08310 [Oscillospiraceae bacterium]|nr:hypothetical protein [Oscillospiraceae bacterium]